MRLRQFLIALDQLANTLAGGWADEALSARAWRNRHRSRAWGWAVTAINALFLDPEHCRESYESEYLRRQLPAEYRT